MIVTTKPAVVRDASWITANLRSADHEEAFCQLPEGTQTSVLAHHLVHSGESFVAYLDGEPVSLYGTSPINASCFGVWCIGTDQLERTIPAISRHLMTEIVERRIQQDGARTMEARSLVTHTAAHKWMLAMGAEQHGGPFPFGRNDELFLMFRWTVAGYRAIREKRWSD